jgi:hypothetical protein
MTEPELCRISDCPNPAAGDPVLIEFTAQHGPSGGKHSEWFQLCAEHRAAHENGQFPHYRLSGTPRFAEG